MGYDLRISSKFYDGYFDNEGAILQSFLEKKWKKEIKIGIEHYITKEQVYDLFVYMKKENEKQGKKYFSEMKIDKMENIYKTMEKKDKAIFYPW